MPLHSANERVQQARRGPPAHAGVVLFVFYNFVRIHKTLKVTPAMAAGVTDRLWDVEDMVRLVEGYGAPVGIEEKARSRTITGARQDLYHFGKRRERRVWESMSVDRLADFPRINSQFRRRDVLRHAKPEDHGLGF